MPDITYMDCWHYIAPLIPINTDDERKMYVMIFNALNQAEKKRMEERKESRGKKNKPTPPPDESG